MRSLVLCLIAVLGCTSNGDDAGSGQPPGGGLDAADAISATVTSSDGGDTSSVARIMLGSTSNLCADAGASPAIDRKGQHFVDIELRDVDGAMRTAPTAPGVYTIYPNTGEEPAKAASLTVGVLDDTCQVLDETYASGQSGTVMLTSVSAGVYAGSYDVVLNTGDHISGTFQPTACPQLANALVNPDEHTCE
jgi:hypothetical protein